MKRIIFLKFLLILLIFLGVYITIEENEEAAIVSATMFQGNNQHTGSYDTTSVESFGEIKWRFKTNSFINTAPIVSGDIVYIGSDDDHIYAVDINSGKELWKFKAEGDVRSTPCITDDTIYFNSIGEDEWLYALDKSTGLERWSFKLGERIFKYDKNAVNITSSPVVSNDDVFFGSLDGHLYALDTATGQLKWRFKTNGPVRSSPAIYKEKIYFGSLDGNLYALDINDGALVWKYKTHGHVHSPQGQISSSPMIVDNRVYFGSWDYNFYALDATTGAEKWYVYLPDNPVYSTPAYKEGVIYFGTYGFHTPRVVAIDTKGENKWTFRRKDREVKDEEGRIFIGAWTNEESAFTASPIIAEDTLYIGSWDYNLYAFDLKSGEERWSFTADGPIGGAAAISNGVVYVGSYDGYLYAISKKEES